MKVHREGSAEQFKPITLTIEITSREELQALWHRLDVSGVYLAKRYGIVSHPPVGFPDGWIAETPKNNDSTEPLFAAIDSLAIERGLRTGGRIGHE